MTYDFVLLPKMRRIFLFVFVFFTFCGLSYGMTKSQVKKVMTVMKNQCMSKIGLTEDKIKNIEQGEFIAEHNVMCYIACVYKTIKVVKNDRLDKELISKQIDILYPQEIRESTKRAVEECIQTQDKYSDSCEGIFYATKCLYDSDPSNFIFP